MEYKVIPLVSSINKGTCINIADQLENIINEYHNHGWMFMRLESVSTFVHPKPGCFGLGAKPGYTATKQMIIFQK